MTDEMRIKHSDALTGRALSEETEIKMSEAKKGKLPNNTKAVIVDGVEYASAKEASSLLKIPYTSFLRKLNNPEMNNFAYKKYEGNDFGKRIIIIWLRKSLSFHIPKNKKHS